MKRVALLVILVILIVGCTGGNLAGEAKGGIKANPPADDKPVDELQILDINPGPFTDDWSVWAESKPSAQGRKFKSLIDEKESTYAAPMDEVGDIA